jgi:hypothetical protein
MHRNGAHESFDTTSPWQITRTIISFLINLFSGVHVQMPTGTTKLHVDMALTSVDARECSLITVIEGSIFTLRIRRSYPKGWPLSSPTFYENYFDPFKCSREDSDHSTIMTFREIEYAAA